MSVRLQRAWRLLVAGGLVGAVVAIPATAVLTSGSDPAPRVVAQECLITVPNGQVIDACGPGISGGAISAGAPSQELITLKNLCNLYIGGCSSAFFYPPAPVNRPNVDNLPRHRPVTGAIGGN